jgi:hypothetical protein
MTLPSNIQELSDQLYFLYINDHFGAHPNLLIEAAIEEFLSTINYASYHSIQISPAKQLVGAMFINALENLNDPKL